MSIQGDSHAVAPDDPKEEVFDTLRAQWKAVARATGSCHLANEWMNQNPRQPIAAFVDEANKQAREWLL